MATAIRATNRIPPRVVVTMCRLLLLPSTVQQHFWLQATTAGLGHSFRALQLLCMQVQQHRPMQQEQHVVSFNMDTTRALLALTMHMVASSTTQQQLASKL